MRSFLELLGEDGNTQRPQGIIVHCEGVRALFSKNHALGNKVCLSIFESSAVRAGEHVWRIETEVGSDGTIRVRQALFACQKETLNAINPAPPARQLIASLNTKIGFSYN